MLQSHYNKNKINYLPERYLSPIYSDKKSSYDNFFVTYGKHFYFMIAKQYFFLQWNRNQPSFRTPLVGTVFQEKEGSNYFGVGIWEIVLDEIKKIGKRNLFRESTLRLTLQGCSLRFLKCVLKVFVLLQARSSPQFPSILTSHSKLFLE